MMHLFIIIRTMEDIKFILSNGARVGLEVQMQPCLLIWQRKSWFCSRVGTFFLYALFPRYECLKQNELILFNATS